MATEKKINYEMQGHKKPARNYLGKQKTVKNIPIKWKSGPKAPATELAYITKAEKDLILKKDLHGSLKHGPNTGPDGIMSLDAQGDYTRDRSPGAYTGGGGSPAQQSSATGTSPQALRNRAMNEQHMKEILTGQKDIGQTASVSDRVRQGAVPEYVNVKQPDGTYKRKYVGSAYKDTGSRGLLSRLFRGANQYGYGQTYGTGAGRFFDKKSSIRFNPQTGQYESEEERVGDLKPGWGGRILGGLASMVTGIPFVGGMIGNQIDKYKPKTYMEKMSDDERRRVANLQMVDGELVDTRNIENKNIPVRSNVPMASIDRWTNPINQNVNFGNTIAPFSGYTGTQQVIPDNAPTGIDESALNYLSGKGINFNQGGRAGYAFGDRVEQETDFIEGPQGGEEFQETVVEGQEQPSREQLEALSMEIFQLPLEELDEQQLLVVYQEAMQGQPMEEAVQEEDVQFAANGGLAGLL